MKTLKFTVRLLLGFGLGLSVMLAACTGGGPTPQPQSTSPDVPGAGVSASTARAVVAEGQLVPRRFVHLSFGTSGMVAEVLVNEGQKVEAGDVLAYLGDRARYEAAVVSAQKGLLDAQRALADLHAQAAVAAAKAQVDVVAAKQLVSDTQKALNALVNPGTAGAQQRVADAQLAYDNALTDLQLAGYGPNAQAVQSAKTEYDIAAFAYNDYKANCDAGKDCNQDDLARLHSRFINAQDKLTAAEIALNNQVANDNAAVAKALSALETAKANLAALLIPPDPLRVEQAEADLALAQANLSAAATYYAKVKNGPDPDALAIAEAEVANAEATVTAAQAALAELQLRAPYAGTVAELDLQAGQFVGNGQPVILLADLSSWLVETTNVDEYELIGIEVGETAMVTFAALPNVALPGRVSFISPVSQVDKQGKTTYTVQITLDELDSELYWGMTALATLEPATAASASD